MKPALFETSVLTRRRARHHSRCECDRDTLDSPWKAEMCEIVHTVDRDRARMLLDLFLSEHLVEVDRIIKRVQRGAHLDYRDKNEPFSYFGEALLRMVDRRWRAKDGGGGASQVFNKSWNIPAILEAETRDSLRTDRKRGLLNGTHEVPGQAAKADKQKYVGRSRELFSLEYDREPSDAELVEFHNSRMLATRKDAARQAVLITAADLRAVEAVPVDDPKLGGERRLTSTDAPDMDQRHRHGLLEGIIEACAKYDLEVDRARRRQLNREPVRRAEVARAMFEPHIRGLHEGELPLREEVVEELGARSAPARREVGSHYKAIIELARERFADQRPGE